MKIYKYTSIKSAISILKSGRVVLNNPEVFNDPNDCSFKQDKIDKNRIDKLSNDYLFFKAISELTALKKLDLNKKNKALLTIVQKEMNAYKRILEINPYFDRIPGFNLLSRLISVKSPEVNSKLSLEKQKLHNAISQAVENAKSAALISCFSRRNNSTLMWSHYANSHEGVCIEYERPHSLDFRDVIYQKSRPTMKLYKVVAHAIALDFLGKKETGDELEKHLKETLEPFFIKSKDWSYEEEIRCLFTKSNSKDKIQYDGLHYTVDIGKPTAIYVGCNSSGDAIDHLIKLAHNREIPVHFMKKSEESFDIVVNEIHEYKQKTRTKEKEITLSRLINDIDRCLNERLYLAAYAASLIVPSICSQVEALDTDSPKDGYIKWCDKYLPSTIRDQDGDQMAHLTGEIIWNIKEKLFTESNVDAFGKYEDFELKKIVLRVEERNGFDIYPNIMGESDLTINVTGFCTEILNNARRCYEEHKVEIESLNQLPFEDFDAQLESMNELSITNERINKHINGK